MVLRKANIALNNFNQLVFFIIETLRFSCDLGTEFLSLIEIKLELQKFNSHSFLLSQF